MSAPDAGMRPPSLAIGDRNAEFSLLDLVNTVLRHRRLVLGFPLLAALLLVGVGLLLPRKYTSSASFMPQGTEGSTSNLAGLAAQFGVALPKAEPGQSPEFYADLLTSREILRGVLATTYTFEAGGQRYQGTLVALLHPRGATPEDRHAAALRELRKRIVVKAEPEIGVVRFSVQSRWAELSRQVADRMLERVNEFNLKRRQSQAAAERRFVEERLANAREELRTAERELQEFLERNRDFRNSPLLIFAQGRLQQEVSMRQAVYTSLAQSFEKARIDEIRNTPVITVVESPDRPVRPDRRGLLLKAALMFVVVFFVAFAIAFGRELMLKSRREDPEEFERFAALRREAFEGWRQPWFRRKHHQGS